MLIKMMLMSIIMFLTVNAGNLYAHDDTRIHPEITKQAVEISTLDVYLKKKLNLINGVETKLLSDIEKSIVTWLRDGSTAEDSPICRASNHFHDPLKTWDAAAMSDSPWWLDVVCNSWKPFYSNVTWATGFTSPTSTPIPNDPNNSRSPNVWDKARAFYYNALTASTKVAREAYFAQTFLALGQAVHLLQDMSSPAHVRNDFQSHLIFTGFCTDDQCSGNPTKWFDNPFEHYIKANSRLLSTAISSPLAFTHPRLTDFWDTDQYNGGNLSTGTTLGLSEITNANFFSDNTIPNNNPSTEHRFTYPQIDATNCNICEDYEMGTTNLRRYICRNSQSDPLAKITSISFLNEEESIASANLSSLRLSLDDNVHNAYATELIPLAIGYSSQALSYFFRGQFDVEMGAGSVKVKNASTETIAGDDAESNSFELFYDNDSGQRQSLAKVKANALPPGSEQTIRFSPPTGAVSYMLVYSGKLGDEMNAVAGKYMSGYWEPWDGPLVTSQNDWQEIFYGTNPFSIDGNGVLHFELASPATGTFACIWIQTSIPIPHSELYFNISSTLTSPTDIVSSMYMRLVDDHGNNKTIVFSWSSSEPPPGTWIFIGDHDGKTPISLSPLTGHITFITIGVNLFNEASGQFQSHFIDFR